MLGPKVVFMEGLVLGGTVLIVVVFTVLGPPLALTLELGFEPARASWPKTLDSRATNPSTSNVCLHVSRSIVYCYLSVPMNLKLQK